MADTFLAWLKKEIVHWEAIAQNAPPGRPFVRLAFSGMSGGEDELADHDAIGRLNIPAGEGWRDDASQNWGHVRVREEVAGIYGAASADNVLLVSGATQANFLVLSALRHLVGNVARPVALVESPGYGPLFEVPRYLGFTLVPMHRTLENDFGFPSLTAAEANADIAVVSNPHNPSGVLVPPAQIELLLGQLPERTILVVDETFLSPADGHLSAAALRHPRIVTLASLSKTFAMNFLRAGWIIAHGETLDALRELWILGFNIGSKLTESIAADVLRKRSMHEKRTLGLARANGEVVAATLDIFQTRGLISWKNPGQGSIAFPRLMLKTGSEPKAAVMGFYRKALEQFQLAFIPGHWFDPMDPDRTQPGGPRSPCQSHIRIGYGAPTAQVQAAVVRLREAIEANA